MSLAYHCPKCDALLNPNVRVVLIARFGTMNGIVLMSSQLGDYQVICDMGFCHEVSKGDIIEFKCPVCHKSLTSESHKTFAELKVINTEKEDNNTCLVRFSRVSEEHATFLYDDESMKEFGDKADVFHDQMKLEGDWSW